MQWFPLVSFLVVAVLVVDIATQANSKGCITADNNMQSTHNNMHKEQIAATNVGRFQYQDDGIILSENQPKPSDFFFALFPHVKPKLTICGCNDSSGLAELTLGVSLYNTSLLQSTKSHIKNRCDAEHCGISLLPMHSIRFVKEGLQTPESKRKYTLISIRKWNRYTQLRQIVEFIIYDSNLSIFENLKISITSYCRLSNCEVQYTLHNQQRAVRSHEVCSEHVTKTSIYNQIKSQYPPNGHNKVALTCNNYKNLFYEIMNQIPMNIRVDEGHESMQDPDDIDRTFNNQRQYKQSQLTTVNNRLRESLYWIPKLTPSNRFSNVLNTVLKQDVMDADKFRYDFSLVHEASKQTLKLDSPFQYRDHSLANGWLPEKHHPLSSNIQARRDELGPMIFLCVVLIVYMSIFIFPSSVKSTHRQSDTTTSPSIHTFTHWNKLGEAYVRKMIILGLATQVTMMQALEVNITRKDVLLEGSLEEKVPFLLTPKLNQTLPIINKTVLIPKVLSASALTWSSTLVNEIKSAGRNTALDLKTNNYVNSTSSSMQAKLNTSVSRNKASSIPDQHYYSGVREVLRQFDKVDADLQELVIMFSTNKNSTLLKQRSNRSAVRIARDSFGRRDQCYVSKDKLTGLQENIQNALSDTSGVKSSNNCELEGESNDCNEVIKLIQCGVHHLKSAFLKATENRVSFDDALKWKNAYDNLDATLKQMLDDLRKNVSGEYLAKIDKLQTDLQRLSKRTQALERTITDFCVLEMHRGNIDSSVKCFQKLEDDSKLSTIITEAYNHMSLGDPSNTPNNARNIAKFIGHLPSTSQRFLALQSFVNALKRNNHYDGLYGSWILIETISRLIDRGRRGCSLYERIMNLTDIYVGFDDMRRPSTCFHCKFIVPAWVPGKNECNVINEWIRHIATPESQFAFKENQEVVWLRPGSFFLDHYYPHCAGLLVDFVERCEENSDISCDNWNSWRKGKGERVALVSVSVGQTDTNYCTCQVGTRWYRDQVTNPIFQGEGARVTNDKSDGAGMRSWHHSCWGGWGGRGAAVRLGVGLTVNAKEKDSGGWPLWG